MFSFLFVLIVLACNAVHCAPNFDAKVLSPTFIEVASTTRKMALKETTISPKKLTAEEIANKTQESRFRNWLDSATLNVQKYATAVKQAETAEKTFKAASDQDPKNAKKKSDAKNAFSSLENIRKLYTMKQAFLKSVQYSKDNPSNEILKNAVSEANKAGTIANLAESKVNELISKLRAEKVSVEKIKSENVVKESLAKFEEEQKKANETEKYATIIANSDKNNKHAKFVLDELKDRNVEEKEAVIDVEKLTEQLKKHPDNIDVQVALDDAKTKHEETQRAYATAFSSSKGQMQSFAPILSTLPLNDEEESKKNTESDQSTQNNLGDVLENFINNLEVSVTPNVIDAKEKKRRIEEDKKVERNRVIEKKKELKRVLLMARYLDFRKRSLACLENISKDFGIHSFQFELIRRFSKISADKVCIYLKEMSWPNYNFQGDDTTVKNKQDTNDKKSMMTPNKSGEAEKKFLASKVNLFRCMCQNENSDVNFEGQSGFKALMSRLQRKFKRELELSLFGPKN